MPVELLARWLSLASAANSFLTAEQVLTRAASIADLVGSPTGPYQEISASLRADDQGEVLRGVQALSALLQEREPGLVFRLRHRLEAAPLLRARLAQDAFGLKVLSGGCKKEEKDPLLQEVKGILQAVQESGNGNIPDLPQAALTVHELAERYKSQGAHSEALPLYRLSLQMAKRAFGAEHLYVGAILNGLGEIRQTQGDFQEAEALYQRSLHLAESQGGASLLAAVLNNQASLHFSLWELDRAEFLSRRSLRILETVHGKDHADYGRCLVNLAEIYAAKGEEKVARRFLNQALPTLKRVLGAEHPEVLKISKKVFG